MSACGPSARSTRPRKMDALSATVAAEKEKQPLPPSRSSTWASPSRGSQAMRQFGRNEMRRETGVALVTGAGSGIGRQVALTLDRRGWKVAGLDRNREGLEELQQQLATEQRTFVWAMADVRDPKSLLEEVRKLSRQLGPIDLLVAAAGVAGETPALGMQPEAIDRIISINL